MTSNVWMMIAKATIFSAALSAYGETQHVCENGRGVNPRNECCPDSTRNEVQLGRHVNEDDHQKVGEDESQRQRSERFSGSGPYPTVPCEKIPPNVVSVLVSQTGTCMIGERRFASAKAAADWLSDCEDPKLTGGILIVSHTKSGIPPLPIGPLCDLAVAKNINLYMNSTVNAQIRRADGAGSERAAYHVVRSRLSEKATDDAPNDCPREARREQEKIKAKKKGIRNPGTQY
ncbi:MAG TPA: hypothetical protein VMY42_18315 [Thermoguttaceae bacterium]|nr:hypothetical protein [Thermoguttaceae bacterium]